MRLPLSCCHPSLVWLGEPACGSSSGLLATPRRIRWYNPKLGGYEWRALPKSDEEALSLLDGSPYTSICTRTYHEWRDLGAGILAALIRAGEAAKRKEEEEEEGSVG